MFSTLKPSSLACCLASTLSSQQTVSTPLLFKESKTEIPVLPKPRTAALLPESSLIKIIIYRNFSVARPISANITDIIQKRITI